MANRPQSHRGRVLAHNAGVSYRWGAFLPGLMWLALSAHAQSNDPTADRMAPATRASQIEAERQQKAAQLAPDDPSHVEQVLNYIKSHKIVERVTCEVTGLCLHLGGLITGSGFAAGPAYVNRDLLHGQAVFHAWAAGSLSKFYRMETGLAMPQLAGGLFFTELDAVRFD